VLRKCPLLTDSQARLQVWEGMSSAAAMQPVLEACGLRPKRTRVLQSLWAGYGEALEVDAEDADGASVALIVKRVKPPGGRALAGDEGHQRKLR
jgi:hypothetical protein